LLDFDYLDQLNDEEKAWLNKFAGEFIGASFEKEDKKRPGKRRKFKNLHKTPEQVKSCYDANNSRNRDVLTRAKAMGKAVYIDDIVTNESELNDLLCESLNQSNNETGDSNEE
jgi:hypothetical protein